MSLVWFLLGFVLALSSGLASAGYQTTVTAIVTPYTYNAALGSISGCYLTPSMAAASQSSYPLTITAVHPELKTMDVILNTGKWVVTYSDCTTTPAVRAFPAFTGGVEDPAIIDNGIASGSSNNVTVTGDLTVPNLSDLSVEEGSQIATSILVLWSVAWVFRQLIRMARDSDVHSEDS